MGAASLHFAKCVLELGGKNPAIVTSSANVAISAKRIVWGAFTNCGQTCVRPEYVMVHSSIANDFISNCRSSISLFYEDATESEWYGRLIHSGAAKRIQGYLDTD